MNLNTEHYDRRIKRAPGQPKKNTSESPRTRPGAAHPGGRILRRRLAKLGKRKDSMPNGKSGYRMPGSMTK